MLGKSYLSDLEELQLPCPMESKEGDDDSFELVNHGENFIINKAKEQTTSARTHPMRAKEPVTKACLYLLFGQLEQSLMMSNGTE